MENYNQFNKITEVLFQEENGRGTRLLHSKNYSPTGDSGDTSVRDPATGLIYVSGSPLWVRQRDLGDARGWERTIMDENCNIKNEWSDPTPEATTHAAIYRNRPEVFGIVHTHSEWASVFGILGREVPLKLAGMGLEGFIPCAGYGHAGSPELNAFVVEVLGKDKNCCVMKNHGAIAVGDTLDSAFAVIDWLEEVAQRAYYTILHYMQTEKLTYDEVIEKYAR